MPPPAILLLSRRNHFTQYCAAHLDAAYQRLYIAAQRLSTSRETTPEFHQNSLDARNSGAGSLIQADRIVRAVIELGGARRLAEGLL
jgi:hypothetical protein